jgi:shikimate dehydrogenase
MSDPDNAPVLSLRVLAERDPAFADWHYGRFAVKPEQLPEALKALHKRGFRGINLTVPHKVQAVDLVRSIDPEARRMGAVNTLVYQKSGYKGYNTDGYGLARAVAETLHRPLADADVLLLGAGGAARAAAVQCLRDGCRSLWIGNRTPARLTGLVEAIGASDDARVHRFNLARPPAALPRRGVLIINATSLGLKPEDPQPLDLKRFAGDTVVYDMIYNPRETPLMAQARAQGMSAANGLSMLVYQGLRSLEIWSGQPVPADVMFAAARKAMI